MSNLESIGLSTLLCLPAPDVKALGEGRSICAIPAVFIRPGQMFLLCPSEKLDQSDHLEWTYRSGFHREAQAALEELELDLPEISYWAVCENSLIIDSQEKLESLESLSIWRKEWLTNKLQAQKSIFLSVLRVNRLKHSFGLPAEIVYSEKMGRFLALPEARKEMASLPVLSDYTLERRTQQILNFSSPENPELEELQEAIAQQAYTHLEAKALDDDLKYILGWGECKNKQSIAENLLWIKTIKDLGDRSKEAEGPSKSNWQAGTDFEDIVKKSLEFLGFGINVTHRGGAGGLDFFCSTPYPLTGECKCGRGIPSGTTEELIKLGGMRLPSTDEFLASAKIIIGPGDPTSDVITAARKWRVSIIKPMTLQKLAQIHNQFPLDLIELKEHLKPGQIDSEIDTYIELHLAKIAIRAHVVTTLKSTLQSRKIKEISFEQFCGAFHALNPQEKLTDRDLYDILIELSSPLTGYIGRIKCEKTWKGDRFYYLRDLPAPKV
jgi:hypothetical protein